MLGAGYNKLHTFRMWMDAEGDENERGYDHGAGYEGVPDIGGWNVDGRDDNGWDVRDDRAYWRRRFFILCAGVVALGACAWLFPGVQQPSKRDAAAVTASMAALARQQALPSAATGPAWPTAGDLPAAYPTAPASLVSTPTPKPAKKASAAASHPRAGASTAPATPKTGTCAPSRIVLSLFTSQPSYARGGEPKFSVYAVSTAQAPCTLTYGAGSVQVVATRQGHVVWDSAACKSAPAKPVRFTLGVPRVLTLVWDSAITRPAGCGGSLPAGTSTLDAVAMSHGQSSPVRTFKVDR